MSGGEWKTCKDYVVFVKDGYVLRYFSKFDEIPNVKEVKKPLTLNALRLRLWRALQD